MKTLRCLFVLMLSACGGDKPDPHVPWYPHVPTSWVTTADGNLRDAGPFESICQGYVTDAEIDAEVDAAFRHFSAMFPQLVLPVRPVVINDDYVLWAKYGKGNGQGFWAAGMWFEGQAHITVTLWTRVESVTAPVPCPFIARPPGDSWGVYYANWRWTSRPLVPAIEHELLHTVIHDPGHKSDLWAMLDASPRKAGAFTPYVCEGSGF